MRENILYDRVKNLILAYDFAKPFAIYLKEFFRANRQMGARDRRETRDFCFNYLRIGKNLPQENFINRLAIASFLCSEKNSTSLDYLISNHSVLSINDIGLDLDKKIELVKAQFPDFSLDLVFTDHQLLGEQINKEKFEKSLLIQPRVWIRIKKGFQDVVVDELKSLDIPFQNEEINILSFNPTQNLEQLKSFIAGNFEIQDINSGKIADFFTPKKDDKWWDMCAASGGKSLCLIDKEPNIYILATDIRENILKNYSHRMRKNDFSGYEIQKIDLTKKSIDPGDRFDGIIADVPCTGSGTWARSPEHLLNNHAKNVLQFYQPLQRKLVENSIVNLRENGQLIYSTCSVFASENEENVAYFLEKLPLKLKEMKTLEGYEMKADSLFVASFVKISKK